MLTLIQSWFGRLRRGKIDPTIKSSDITDDIIANDVRTTENVSFSETVGVKKRISVDKQAVTSVKSSFFGHSLPNEESRKSDDLVSESGSLNSQVIDASNNQHAKARLKPIGPMSTTGDSIHSVSAYNIPVSVKDKDLAWDGSFDASNGAITADGSLAAESGCLTTQSQIKTSSIDESSTHLQIPRRMSSLRKQQVLINKPPTNADEGQNNSTTNPIISEPRQEFNQMIAMNKLAPIPTRGPSLSMGDILLPIPDSPDSGRDARVARLSAVAEASEASRRSTLKTSQPNQSQIAKKSTISFQDEPSAAEPAGSNDTSASRSTSIKIARTTSQTNNSRGKAARQESLKSRDSKRKSSGNINSMRRISYREGGPGRQRAEVEKMEEKRSRMVESNRRLMLELETLKLDKLLATIPKVESYYEIDSLQ